MGNRLLSVVVLGCLATACGPVSGVGNNNNYNNTGPCTNGSVHCNLISIEVCNNGAWVLQTTCLSPTPYCTESVMGPTCTPCQPNVDFCVGGDIYSCTPEGQTGTLVQTCTGDLSCSGGTCTSPCLVAAQQKSYIGCDYWPTPTANSQLDPAFDGNFGVVVHNANSKDATITITRGGSPVVEQVVPAGQLQVFELNYVAELKLDAQAEESKIVSGGAYHLTSTMPVTVYQFNPLDFEQGGVFSHTNDASLLLPTYVLSQNYIVMARQTFGVDTSGFGMWSFIPGFMAIVGTENNTQVTVTLAGRTQGGTGVQAGSAGSVQNYTLNQGEVLQIVSEIPTSCSGTQTSDDCNGLGGMCSYCDMGHQYDLTGTIIESTAPVAVFSGHVCDFVPFNYWACDHLEEQMIPLETWGKNFVVGRTEPQAEAGYPDEPNVIRIVSGANNNAIRFNPAQPTVGSGTTLNKGEWVEFLSTQHFHVDADYAVMIGQFLVGQNYYSSGAQADYWGDPAYSLMVPTEQFRGDYTFLAPSTITYNFVKITKRVGEGSPAALLDGVPVDEGLFSTPIGGTPYGVANVPISGTHHSITTSNGEAFGIVIYGFASYTSYSYPGGMDLQYINPVD
ncbi:MAG: IgGFc-binding protein [bacterium]